MRRTSVIAAILCAGLLVPTVAVATPAPTAETTQHTGIRGDLLSAKLIKRIPKQDVAAYLADFHLTVPTRNGVDLYLITYRTVDAKGRPTTASALTVMPQTSNRNLRTVTWLHGTRVYRGYTGSMEDNLDRAAAVMFAASGYATVAPDYLGLGEGPGNHPYMLAKPTVTATMDALKASQSLAHHNDKRLNRKTYVTGFSQGGQASMLVSEELQRRGALAATAAIAGPHDIRGEELPAALDGRLDGVSAVLYLGYAMTAWNRYYPLYSTPSEAFRAPYDQIAEEMFNGNHPEEEVIAALPGTPQELFTDSFLAKMANPTGALQDVLRSNDNPCDWRPRTPVRLYAGTKDRDVVYSNSENCQTQLKANGAKDARLINAGEVDHFGSAMTSLPQILKWFNTIR